jgi:hypothetical protein
MLNNDKEMTASEIKRYKELNDDDGENNDLKIYKF